MNKDTRNAIERATQRARKLLEDDLSTQLEGTFDVLRTGVLAPQAGTHLSARQEFQRDKIVAAIEHKRAAGMIPAEAVTDYVRDAAFTTLNRFVALKMLEARELVQECISKGDQSAGYREFCGMAPGIVLLPDAAGYRLYVESLFDELSTEVKVLFDRRDAASALWPRRQAFDGLLDLLNAAELDSVWTEDETIGWVYQFFNSGDERKRMRDESQAPRNSRELAVRNQFFTPRYVVQFLTDNTLGRTWLQMREGETALAHRCTYLVRDGDEAASRIKKDPRDLKILDPACGSGHFLLYAFELLLTIYEEAWHDEQGAVASQVSGQSLRRDYRDLAALQRAVPALIVQHNLFGVDIDPRCAQIAALALWLRAQRAFKEFGLPAKERVPITRTHIVVAEPMPGDPEIVDAFAARLEPPLLRDLFRKMVGEMRLAGELGTLLRVEDGIAAELTRGREQFIKQRETTFLPEMEPLRRQGELDLSGIDDARFFHEAEARIVDALRRFAESAAGRAGVRRRLFAGDAAQGIALIDLVRTRFDVVLMNPPFGAASLSAKKEFEKAYPSTKHDVYAAFVERGVQLLKSGGLLGAITSRTGFFLASGQQWRENVVLANAPPVVVADLGFGVLDAAMVETAAYVLGVGFSGSSTWFRLVNEADKTEFVKSSRNAYRIQDSRKFATIPLTPFVYWMPEVFFDAFDRIEPFEQPDRSVRCGMGTLDDFRFVRNWWEVSHVDQWTPYAKGGDLSPFVTDMPAVVNFREHGREVKAFVAARVGSASRKIQAESFYFRPGLQYGRRIRNPSPAILPAGAIFSDNANGIFVEGDDRDKLLAYLALLNGDTTKTILTSIAPVRKMEVGYLQKLPMPRVDHTDVGLISCAVQTSHVAISKLTAIETSRYFVSPMASETVAGADCDVSEIEFNKFGIRRDAVESLKRQSEVLSSDDEDSEADETTLDSPLAIVDTPVDNDDRWLSWAVGVAFGRFDIRLATGERPIPAQPDPFAPLAARSAGMVPDGDPPFVAGDGILVDDKGAANDIVARVVSVYERIGKLPLDRETLRHKLGREFFTAHIKTYSNTRRKAPIYWQLATPSGRYSVWLYVHALGRDTLFRVQKDCVEPKFRQERRRQEELEADAGPNPSLAARKLIDAQRTFVEELQRFCEDLGRIAPVWNPRPDDGVVLTMAPLWRLVPHLRPWQRELKAAWDDLCAGEYDWAHVALYLWPERVIPSCASDRSMAIAHGFEDVFWLQDTDGDWKPRSILTTEIEQLVRQHSSIAVKAALKTLIEAPVVAVGGARPRSRTLSPAARTGSR